VMNMVFFRASLIAVLLTGCGVPFGTKRAPKFRELPEECTLTEILDLDTVIIKMPSKVEFCEVFGEHAFRISLSKGRFITCVNAYGHNHSPNHNQRMRWLLFQEGTFRGDKATAEKLFGKLFGDASVYVLEGQKRWAFVHNEPGVGSQVDYYVTVFSKASPLGIAVQLRSIDDGSPWLIEEAICIAAGVRFRRYGSILPSAEFRKRVRALGQ